jgi:hypothetical protein
MDKATFKFWTERSSQLEKDRNKWRDIARRLANPVHDDYCEYAAPCTYCQAMKEVDKHR